MSAPTAEQARAATLESLNVIQLRRYMREKLGIRESRVGSAAKPDLLHRAEHGKWPEEPVAAKSSTPAGTDSLADAIAQAIQGRVSGGTDENRVREIAQDVASATVAGAIEAAAESARNDAERALLRMWTELEKPRPISVTITTPEGLEKDCGVQHATFPELLQFAAARVNVNLVGPAGSGKTRGAEEVAKALGLAFDFMPVGPMTSKSDILGYMDAGGCYHASAFRRQYEAGGVFLFDEIDAGNPGVMTTINGAIAGDWASFPDRMIARHPDFICIAAANTFGRGADRQYCGRQQLDAATLDRFAVVEWLYDNALELAIAGDTDWTRFCQKVRAGIEKAGVRHVVSPRASIAGNRLLAGGMARDRVEQAIVWKGLDADTVASIQKAMR